MLVLDHKLQELLAVAQRHHQFTRGDQLLDQHHQAHLVHDLPHDAAVLVDPNVDLHVSWTLSCQQDATTLLYITTDTVSVSAALVVAAVAAAVVTLGAAMIADTIAAPAASAEAAHNSCG
jgi:hypothetical protein